MFPQWILMFPISNHRLFECCSYRSHSPNAVVSMTPKNKKPSKAKSSISSRAASALLAMGKTFSCTNIASVSTCPKSANNMTISFDGNQQHHRREAHDNNFYDDTSERITEGQENQHTKRQSLLQNEDLLLTVSDLRQQLEHLKDVLEERDRVDAEKDKLIERLTNAVRNSQIPSCDDRNEYRRRSFSGGANLHLKLYKSELRVSAAPEPIVISDGVVAYDDDDLV